MARFDLDGKDITPLTICLIGGGGFIGSHLCDKLMQETSHMVIVIDTSDHNITPFFKEIHPWLGRIKFHKFDTKYDSHLESLIKMADVIINLVPLCTYYDYVIRPVQTICRNFLNAVSVVKFCTENEKRLIHFSTCEVYGKTIGSFLPKDDPLCQEANFNILKEDTSPCVLGSVVHKSWLYACANQLMERLINGEATENGLKFTIVRPFNWIGPRMEYSPIEVIPWVITMFENDILVGNPIRLMDFGESQHTLVYIDDAIEAVLLMIENPSRANGQIFNVGNPNLVVTTKQLGKMMIEVFSKVSGLAAPDPSTMPTVEMKNDVAYDIVKFIPDVTVINRQLGWKPTTSLPDLLEVFLWHLHRIRNKRRRYEIKNATSF